MSKQVDKGIFLPVREISRTGTDCQRTGSLSTILYKNFNWWMRTSQNDQLFQINLNSALQGYITKIRDSLYGKGCVFVLCFIESKYIGCPRGATNSLGQRFLEAAHSWIPAGAKKPDKQILRSCFARASEAPSFRCISSRDCGRSLPTKGPLTIRFASAFASIMGPACSTFCPNWHDM